MKPSPMKLAFSLLSFAITLLLTGCESMPERFAGAPPQVLSVDGSVEQVYKAAQKAFKRLDFKVTRSTMGRVEAASSINSSVTFADARQIVARVRITQGEPGKSDVELALTEEVTSKSMGGTRQHALREHSFFQIYFAALQQVLQENAPDKAAEKN
jgi:hypothetical protein